jgi:RNA polymerase sigma-70 factor (ECF subfamily)
LVQFPSWDRRQGCLWKGRAMLEGRRRKDLIAKAQAGDREAFDALILGYRESLVKYISAALGPALRGKLEVEDLVQETFLRVFRSLEDFELRGKETFETWLQAIARHVVQDGARHLRRKKRDCAREIHLASKSSSGSPLPDPLDQIAGSSIPSGATALRREERFARLQQALDALSPDHREVIRLARIERLSMKEVAARMGRSVGAVSVLLVRAMRKLKRAFGATESFHLSPPRAGEQDRRHGR